MRYIHDSICLPFHKLLQITASYLSATSQKRCYTAVCVFHLNILNHNCNVQEKVARNYTSSYWRLSVCVHGVIEWTKRTRSGLKRNSFIQQLQIEAEEGDLRPLTFLLSG